MTLAPVGILVTLSAFVILYKSYQARGYLQFLGNAAKTGTLPEENLPMAGWPPKRVGGWRDKVWCSPWLGRFSDLLEPYMFLPALLIAAWLFVLLRRSLTLNLGLVLGLAVVLTAFFLALLCMLWVHFQTKDEQ